MPSAPIKQPNVNLTNFHDTLLRADYHGAKLKIVHSRVANQVGAEGIVALETKNIFYLAMLDNRIIKIAKEHTIFTCSMSDESRVLDHFYES